MDSLKYMLEVDVMQLNELEEASNFAASMGLPSLVVQPTIFEHALFYKHKFKGKYKIFTTVDWPKGESPSHAKFRGMPVDAMEADGFEIMLSTTTDPSQIGDEMRVLMEFSRLYMKEIAEFRFVVGTLYRSVQDVLKMCEVIPHLSPKPTVLRTDVNLKPQVNKANPDLHNKLIKAAQAIMPLKFKVAGNLNNLKAVSSTSEASLFAVSLTQAKNIISELTSTKGPGTTKAFA